MPTYEELDAMLEALVAGEDADLDAALDHQREAGLPPIQVARLQGRLLQLLVSLTAATTVLEIGTLGGYSTIHLARGLAEGGRVTSLELDPHHAEVALANLARAGVADRVDVIVGPALESLERLAAEGYGPIDLAFVDADKTNNPAYVRRALELSRPGTVIVVDNVVRGGRIADREPDEASRGALAAIELLGGAPNVEATVLQMVGTKGHDGMLLAVVGAGPA